MPRTSPRLARLLLIAVLAPISWCRCQPGSQGTDPIDNQTKTMLSLIDKAERKHDFGLVVSKGDSRRSHSYHMSNQTGRTVSLLDVVNRKACCGLVRVGKTELPPGGSTYVEVTLLLADRFGEVIHETDVVTNSPGDEVITLRTSATARAAIRVEPETQGIGPKADEAAPSPRIRNEFRVYSTGTEDDPPVDLDSVTLRSASESGWLSPKKESVLGDGLSGYSRAFFVLLDAAGSPGPRTDQVLLEDRNTVLFRHPITWMVVAPIVCSPEILVLKPGQTNYRLVLSSNDKMPFRILRVESRDLRLQAKPTTTVSATTQVVEVECGSLPKHPRGSISVFTDHEKSNELKVACLVLE